MRTCAVVFALPFPRIASKILYIHTDTPPLNRNAMSDAVAAPPITNVGLDCAVCRRMSDEDNAELTSFITDVLEKYSLSRMFDQVGGFLEHLERRRKQHTCDASAPTYQFSAEEIRDHVHFCVATREDAVLRVLVKHKLLERMHEAQNVPQLVALSKMLHQTLPALRRQSDAP